MARTYEEHKTDVDAANPTPAINWYLYRDDLSHEYDDKAVARGELEFGNQRTVYEVHVHGQREALAWYAFSVADPDGARRQRSENHPSWSALSTAFALSWENLCEYQRRQMATFAYVRDVLTDDSIGNAPEPEVPVEPEVVMSPDALLTAVGTPAGTVALGLAPAFSQQVNGFYAATWNAETLEIEVTRSHNRSIVNWVHGAHEVQGLTPTFTLAVGRNIILAKVSAEDGETQTIYAFIITRS